MFHFSGARGWDTFNYRVESAAPRNRRDATREGECRVVFYAQKQGSEQTFLEFRVVFCESVFERGEIGRGDYETCIERARIAAWQWLSLNQQRRAKSRWLEAVRIVVE